MVDHINVLLRRAQPTEWGLVQWLFNPTHHDFFTCRIRAGLNIDFDWLPVWPLGHLTIVSTKCFWPELTILSLCFRIIFSLSACSTIHHFPFALHLHQLEPSIQTFTIMSLFGHLAHKSVSCIWDQLSMYDVDIKTCQLWFKVISTFNIQFPSQHCQLSTGRSFSFYKKAWSCLSPPKPKLFNPVQTNEIDMPA